MRMIPAFAFVFSLVVITACQPPFPQPPVPESSPLEPVVVQHVVQWVRDGDTIELDDGDDTTRLDVRFIGIDTPERGECGSNAAKARLLELVPIGTTVGLEYDEDRRDRYDRLLAYVWLDGVMINDLMVDEGWAAATYYAPNGRHRSRFEQSQAAARSTGRGSWRTCAAGLGRLAAGER